MTFDRQDTIDKVTSIIAAELKIDKSAVQESTEFTKLGADSLDMVEIIMRLEEQFGIEISDEDAEKLTTVGSVVDYIQTHRTK